MSVEKLKEEMAKKDYTIGGISWGPEAHKLTADERAEYLLKVIEEIDAYHALPEVERIKMDIVQVYEDLKPLMDLCKIDVKIEDFSKPLTEDKKNLLHIGCVIDMALVHLSNWISNEEHAKIMEKINQKNNLIVLNK